VTLAYNVHAPEEVDAVLEEAEAAGATIGRPGAKTNPHWRIEDDGSVRI
jgi:hypothetical protein